MPGDPLWPSKKETAKDLRRKWPTSVAFLRAMAALDFDPKCQERFTEAADEIEQAIKTVRLLLEIADAPYLMNRCDRKEAIDAARLVLAKAEKDKS